MTKIHNTGIFKKELCPVEINMERIPVASQTSRMKVAGHFLDLWMQSESSSFREYSGYYVVLDVIWLLEREMLLTY